MRQIITAISVGIGGVLVAGATAVGNEVTVYQNDFSVRQSIEPVASTNWVVSHYATNDAALAMNHTVKAETIGFGAVNPWQDGWFKMHRGKTYAENNQNLGLWVVRDDGGNAYASYSTSIPGSQTLHAHPIYNAITCGVIRTTFDVRIPKKVHYNESRLAFTLGTRNMMVESSSKSDMVATGYGVMKKSLFEAGFKVNNYAATGGAIVSEEESKRVLGVGWDYGRNPTTGNDESKTGPWPGGGLWARVEVEADLDAGTYDARMSYLGTGHPTFETAMYNTNERTGRKFYTAYNPSSDGPITGIIFHSLYSDTGAYGKSASYYGETDYDDDYAFKMDNIKMEWKAPGKTGFETFYMNDFYKCSRRTLSPIGSTSCAYNASSAARTETFTYDSSYVMPYGDYDNKKVTKFLVAWDVNGVNPVGYDGWRRTDGNPSVYITTCGVHRVLAMVGGSRGWLVQQFGETPTSGKVKFEYDMRAPSKMWYTTGALQGWAMACLGSKDDWTCTENPTQYFRSGMTCGGTGDNQTKVYPFFKYSGWNDGFVKTADTLLTSQHWYRMAMTFDLDADPKTCTMTCTEIGADLIGVDDAPAAGAKTMDGGTRKFLNAYKDLSMIVLGTYAAGSSSIAESMLVTNLKVTKNVGTESEKVIYKNDFKTRTSSFDSVAATRLTPSVKDRMFEGLDAWQLNNTGTINAYVTTGDNPAVMSANAINLGYFAQSIGGHYSHGTFVVSADFRVPDYWNSNNGWCDVLFGNDMLKTGTNDMGSPNNAYNHPSNLLLGMRLFSLNTADTVDGLYNRSRIGVACGNSFEYGTDLTTNHWYRSVCTVYLSGNGAKSKTVDVAIYDMGTTHPTVDTALPSSAVATAAGRPLNLAKRTGDDIAHLSTVGIRLRNTANYAFWKGDESGSPIIDNIVVRRVIPGLMIILK